MTALDRRTFLSRSVRAAAGVGLLGAAGCRQGEAHVAASASTSASVSSTGQLYRISLAQWSFHRQLQGKESPGMDNLDFAAKAKSLGIEAVEYVNQFFKDKARDRAYLTEMRRRAEGEGVQSLLIMCDGEGRLGDPRDDARTVAIENHQKWVEAAAFLGCHSIRVNAASAGTREEQKKLAVDGLRRLTEYGAEHEINIIVENHGGLSSDGAWLASVLAAVDHPRCGSLPDFGNFRIGPDREYDRYRGVEELMPFAKAVSAKSHDFDEDGDEVHTDYLKMMKIVLDAGYRGWVGIEYEGRKLSEEAGVLATKALLERVREQLG